jgi:hypothetical protein
MNKVEKSKDQDKLEVTIIPVDDEPYSKIINIPSSMMGKCSALIDLPDLATQSGTTAVAGSSTIVSASATAASTQPQYPSLKDIF